MELGNHQSSRKGLKFIFNSLHILINIILLYTKHFFQHIKPTFREKKFEETEQQPLEHLQF